MKRNTSLCGFLEHFFDFVLGFDFSKYFLGLGFFEFFVSVFANFFFFVFWYFRYLYRFFFFLNFMCVFVPLYRILYVISQRQQKYFCHSRSRWRQPLTSFLVFSHSEPTPIRVCGQPYSNGYVTESSIYSWSREDTRQWWTSQCLVDTLSRRYVLAWSTAPRLVSLLVVRGMGWVERMSLYGFISVKRTFSSDIKTDASHRLFLWSFRYF